MKSQGRYYHHQDTISQLILLSMNMHLLHLMPAMFHDQALHMDQPLAPIISGSSPILSLMVILDGPNAPQVEALEPIDFYPFESRAEFEFSEFLYSIIEMSAGKIDRLMEVLAALYPECAPSIGNHMDLYRLTDNIPQGDIAWNSFSVQYNHDLLNINAPRLPWMDQTYEVWFRNPLDVLENQICNPDFRHKMDCSPKRIFYKGKRQYENLMSENWAWEQVDKIAQDSSTHGAMFAPVVLGSDKTTVSVATGQNDYYPLYISLGNVHNSNILSPLRPHMSTPRITMCPDGQYRCVIYGLGPYIADYPEQAALACIVQNWCPKCTALPSNLDAMGAFPRTHAHTDVLVNTGGIELHELWDDYGIVGDLFVTIYNGTMAFPRADIHELLAPDLLHQKIAVVPSFPGLRHFYQGRGFKQWTGDDSKGLMKVYLPAIARHLPARMVQAVAALINFCYLVCRNVIDKHTLAEIDESLCRFHEHREIFHDLSVSPEGFSFPHLHSLIHFSFLITQFGAPNGLCSSITESKHIKTPLGQMLVTNQWVDKLAAAHVDFTSRGMLDGPNVVENGAPAAQPNEDAGDVGTIDDMVDEPESYSEITLAKTHESPIPALQIAEHELPHITSKVYVHTSVRAVFYAPSDLSGIGGLHHERICSTASWYGGPARRDCVFVGNSDLPDAPGMRGLLVAQVHLFFSLIHDGIKYPCALVHWFSLVGDEPCNKTGMWKVTPDFQGSKHCLNTILRGTSFLPSNPDFTFDKSLDVFQSFYVNEYVDHHAHEIAF
ncbi:hypothetical protein EI94DRAFT_1772091 [Lactarius quietus]|nr:hypothetical protein EI94DRAFT_1772091 [Lactarius quietus]